MSVRLVLVLGLAVLGCGTSEPSRFYMLSPAAADRVRVMEAGEVRLGIYAFEIPQYLQRPNIVTLTGDHRVTIAEYDRWAESLELSLQRILSVNLTAMIPGASVYRYPWRRETGVEFEIEGELLAFALEPDGRVHLVAEWTVRRAGEPASAVRRFSWAEAPAGPDYAAIVDTMNRGVTALSEAIASAVERVRGGPGQ